MRQGELPAAWRLLLAFCIVFGIVGIGFILIYSWLLLVPIAAAIAAVVILFVKSNKRPAG